MLRKALTLGMVVIFALSLLAVSMVTCLTYDAEAHNWQHPGDHFKCKNRITGAKGTFHAHPGDPPWDCTFESH